MVVVFPAPLGPRRQNRLFSSMPNQDPLIGQKLQGHDGVRGKVVTRKTPSHFILWTVSSTHYRQP
jgi:hypothetical protein